MSNRNSFIESTKETDERLEALKQLYPEIFSDGKINLDAFKDVTGTSDLPEGQDRTPGYYGLYWPGKRAAKQLARKEAEGTLEPVPGDGVNEDTTHNIYIEGDNLEVLRILKQSYKGRVKMIYIDPPYNTGNDFIYPDDFKMPVEEYLKITGQADEGGKKLVTNLKSNGSFHTNWLNMMYPRLQLARELLAEDGLIFISIDDNEQANLKLLCDDVFGEENFVSDIVWKNKYGAGAYTVGFISVHEYILCYSKTPITDITSELDEEGQKSYNKKDEKFSIRGGYMTQPLMTNSLGDRPNLMYTIEYNGTTIKPRKQWVWEKERLEKAIANNEVEFNLQKDGTYSVRSKSYLKDENGVLRRGKPLSLMNGPFNQDGTKDIRDLFEDKSIFDFTKPSELIKKFISLQVNNESDNEEIIMDFFSGSATTAQAVMQLNNEDQGKRKFIMIQLPQKCEDKSEAAKAGYSNICEIGKDQTTPNMIQRISGVFERKPLILKEI